MDIQNLGQVYTPDWVVDLMLSLVKNGKNVLEPACGDGRFIHRGGFEKYFAIDIDPKLVYDIEYSKGDFISLDLSSSKFDTIIGNPPYVKYGNIPEHTKQYLSVDYDKRTNLYIYFIDKCLDLLDIGGELIFITPKTFFKNTSAQKLNFKIFNMGTITNVIDLSEENIFKNVGAECVVWRFERANFSRNCFYNESEKTFNVEVGQVYFEDKIDNQTIKLKLSDYFDVKVGAVSGADNIYADENIGDTFFVNSETFSKKTLRKMIYKTANETNSKLIENCQHLKNRGIRKFGDSNWFEWGRYCHESESKRIYVNCKTRHEKPFFKNECKFWDGSISALFPKNDLIDLDYWVDFLNDLDWDRLGFTIGGRKCFGQKSLQNLKI